MQIIYVFNVFEIAIIASAFIISNIVTGILSYKLGRIDTKISNKEQKLLIDILNECNDLVNNKEED